MLGGMEKTYTIEGMTCSHCVNAVTEEISALLGADDVTVDLETSTATVRGNASESDVRTAVEEAGYQVVS